MVTESDLYDNNDVFPPINHENLQVPSIHHHHHHSPPPSSAESESLKWPLLCQTQVLIKWWIHLLRSKMSTFASWFPYNGAIRRKTFWASGATGAVLLWWLRFRFPRMGGHGRGSVDHRYLLQIIRDKDEKIIQLVCQIARMNEVLIIQHTLMAAKHTN